MPYGYRHIYELTILISGLRLKLLYYAKLRRLYILIVLIDEVGADSRFRILQHEVSVLITVLPSDVALSGELGIVRYSRAPRAYGKKHALYHFHITAECVHLIEAHKLYEYVARVKTVVVDVRDYRIKTRVHSVEGLFYRAELMRRIVDCKVYVPNLLAILLPRCYTKPQPCAVN